MKAWTVERLGEPIDVMTLGSTPTPTANGDTIPIDVTCCGLNFADVLMCRGEYQESPTLPFVPGTEVVGRLTSPTTLASGLRLRTGSRVLSRAIPPVGALAEQTLVPTAALLPIDDGITDVDAAATHVTFQTAWFGLHHLGRIRSGDTVLVHAAAGGTGSAAVQVALAAGARVITTAGGPAKSEACRRAGAAVTIDYRREDFVERVLDETDGTGADIIFDPVGGDTTDGSRRCIAFEGRLIIIGFASGHFATIPSQHVFVKNYSVMGLHWPLYERHHPGLVAAANTEIAAMLLDGRINPPRPDVRPMEDAAAALQDLGGRRTTGKVVISVTDAT